MATVTFASQPGEENPTNTTTKTKTKTTTLRRWLTFSTSSRPSNNSSPRPKPLRRPTPKPTTTNTTTTTSRLYRRVTLPRRSSRSKTKPRTISPDDEHTPISLLTSINTDANTNTTTQPPHPAAADTTNPITPPPTSPTSTTSKIRSRSPLSPLSPISLNFSTLFNLSPRSKTIEESSSTYSSSASSSEVQIPPPTVSQEQLTSSYAEYCEAFTAGLTEESYLYQEGETGKGCQPVKEVVIKEEKEKEERQGRCMEGIKGTEEKGKEGEQEERAIPGNDDQREILHWLRESEDEEGNGNSGSDGDDVPLRMSPPARILTPARYEQSRRAARQPQRGKQEKQEHHEDQQQQQQQRHAWWTALRVGWSRMRRRNTKAANPDYN
ncbi:hypothetical protein CBS63078_545 [Aspergillus niger]|nr:hypothetical protein CBS63078_545 [Aspergillus niger]